MTTEESSASHLMRISDSDRDRAASILSAAMAEGRLSPDEHSDRVDAVYAAKTHAEIVPLVSDLPGGRTALGEPPSGLAVRPQTGALASAEQPTKFLNVFGGTEKKGFWRAPARIDAVNVFGGASLDFRDAELPAKVVHMKAICVFGGVEVRRRQRGSNRRALRRGRDDR